MTKEESAKGLMTDAIEGPGIAYWAEVDDVKRNSDGYVESFQVRDAEKEEKDGAWILINADQILKAIQNLLLRFDQYSVSRDLAASFLGNDWDYDANGADVIIQIAAFDKVVFG